MRPVLFKNFPHLIRNKNSPRPVERAADLTQMLYPKWAFLYARPQAYQKEGKESNLLPVSTVTGCKRSEIGFSSQEIPISLNRHAAMASPTVLGSPTVLVLISNCGGYSKCFLTAH